MSEDQIARLIYLLVLLAVVGSSVLVAARRNLNKTLQQVAIWIFIFVGAMAAYELWTDISPSVTSRPQVSEDGRQITISRSLDGHFHVPVTINGFTIETILDTGASALTLSLNDAQRVGIDVETLNFIGRAQTANGTVETARVRLESLTLGGITDHDVPALVNSGEQGTTLLGMRYLRNWQSLEIRRDQLILTR